MGIFSHCHLFLQKQHQTHRPIHRLVGTDHTQLLNYVTGLDEGRLLNPQQVDGCCPVTVSTEIALHLLKPDLVNNNIHMKPSDKYHPLLVMKLMRQCDQGHTGSLDRY